MKYGAILTDPPWSFNVWSEDTGAGRSPSAHYNTMAFDDISTLPVAESAAAACALFRWVCWPSLPDALKVIKDWGFQYKTLGFIWVKGAVLPLFPELEPSTQVGMGYWSRANTEPCLFATRGSPKRLNGDVRQVIIDKRREHSRKPDEIYERIERLVDGPYLEMFARQQWPGWDQWGNETDRFLPNTPNPVARDALVSKKGEGG